LDSVVGPMGDPYSTANQSISQNKL